MKRIIPGLALLLVIAVAVITYICVKKPASEHSVRGITPAKKYALLIGISDPGTDWASVDVQLMEELAGIKDKAPYHIATTTPSRCTKAAIQSHLADFSAKAMPGDYVYVYFSCHGKQVEDTNHDERKFKNGDVLDEVLLLYNKQELLDDELDTAFSAFRKGVRIIFITDCCHSGSIYALNKPPAFDFVPAVADTGLKADMIYMGACQDDELAKGNSGRTYSEFTLKLNKLGYNNKRLNWFDLLNQVRGSLTKIQTPVYAERGSKGVCLEREPNCQIIDPSFQNQIAFKF